MDIDINLRFFTFKWRIFISRQWVQFGVIVAVGLVSAIAAYWGSMRILVVLLLLLGGGAVMLALLKRPNLGFILLFLGAMFVPIVGPSGVNAGVLMVALMLGLWLLDILIRKYNLQAVNSRVLLPVIIFLGISVLAFGMGQIPWFVFANQAPLTAQAGGFAIFVLSAGALLLAAHRLQDERWLRIIVWTFLALGTMYVVGRALRFPQIDRLYNLGFSAGSMFWTWFVALAISQAVYNNHLKQAFTGSFDSGRIRELLCGACPSLRLEIWVVTTSGGYCSRFGPPF